MFVTDGGVERTLRTLGPGDVFGEAAILTDGLRTSNVEAVSDVVLSVISRSGLTGEMGADAPISLFVRALANRFVDLDRQLRAAQG
ncbi:MAG: cyclic nucleotide-binding domain-containing protein [Chromatiales bacterium]|nr:cyclic nucleotide-binding domain-containing protein [Chromatiales bacterium]